ARRAIAELEREFVQVESPISSVMAGPDPRLSGLAELPLERQLGGTSDWRRFGIEQAIERLLVHQVGAHQTGKAKRAVDRALPGLGEAQQEEGDQRDGDLDRDGILAGAEKAGDPEDR